MTIRDALDVYLGYLKARPLSAYSIKTTRSHLRPMVDALGNQWPTYPDLIRWQSSLVVGATTMHHRLRAVRQFFAWCCRMRYIDADPTEGLVVPRRPKKLPRALSDAQMEMLLDWTPTYARDSDQWLVERDRSLLRLLMFTGLRNAELCNLNVGDVNTVARVVSVRGGKGDRDRMVPYPPELDLTPLVLGRRPNEPLFGGAYRHKRLTPNAVGYMFMRKLSAVVGERVTPHMLRHSYATYLARRGRPIMEIKQLLGHSSVATTQMYLEVTAQDLQSTVAALGSLAAKA